MSNETATSNNEQASARWSVLNKRDIPFDFDGTDHCAKGTTCVKAPEILPAATANKYKQLERGCRPCSQTFFGGRVYGYTQQHQQP